MAPDPSESIVHYAVHTVDVDGSSDSLSNQAESASRVMVSVDFTGSRNFPFLLPHGRIRSIFRVAVGSDHGRVLGRVRSRPQADADRGNSYH